MEFYQIRMVNGDEHITDIDPINLTGNWAIIRTYKCLLNHKWEMLGYKKDRVLHIRPANIVSYTCFIDKEVEMS